MKFFPFTCLLLAFLNPVPAQESSELQQLQNNYQAAVQRAVRPLTQSYIQELGRLRDKYTATNRAAEAQQVELEIKFMTDKIAAGDKTAPGSAVAVARPTAELHPATGPASAVLADSHRVLVADARAKVPANSPDGYPLGALHKGDVVTLQYLDGMWKAYGHIASESPDMVVQERGHQDDSRLVIARASTNGKPGAVIALVPPLTAKTPFTFAVPEDRSDLVLRIHKNSENKANPGVVTYSVKILR
jgi:hypothetical protein